MFYLTLHDTILIPKSLCIILFSQGFKSLENLQGFEIQQHLQQLILVHTIFMNEEKLRIACQKQLKKAGHRPWIHARSAVSRASGGDGPLT